MDFAEYVTVRDYKIAQEPDKRVREALKRTPVDELYGSMLDDREHIDPGAGYDFDGAGDAHQLVAERAYYACGRPYYKLYPDFADMFAATSLAVPCRLLRLPHRSFLVRFSAKHPPALNGVRLLSFIFSEYPTEKVVPGVFDYGPVYEKLGVPAPESGTDRMFHSVALLDIDGQTVWALSILTLPVGTDDCSLDAVLEATAYLEEPPLNVDREDYRVVTDTCLRVAVSVCFLASSSHRFLNPDVLNADFPAYLAAVNRGDAGDVSRLAMIADSKRGQRGYTVGRPELLLGRCQAGAAERPPAEPGTPMKYSQVRRAHWHTYRTGKGRAEEKLVFLPPILVRPDLPPDPREKGVRTLRSLRETQT